METHVISSIPFTFEELEQQARLVIEPQAFHYIQGGAGTEETLRGNTLAFSKWRYIPRVGHDTETIDLRTKLFQTMLQDPILFAPVGNQKLANEEGELITARAAQRLNMPYIASTVTSYTLEEIAAANGVGKRWFQLYTTKDERLTNSLIQRAEQAGYEAIIVTADMLASWRIKEIEKPFKGHVKTHPNFTQDPNFIPRNETDEAYFEKEREIFPDTQFTWAKFEHIVQQTTLPVLIKGVLDDEDAIRAVELGAAGIVVSNHGGRLLDGAVSAIEALPSIAKAIDGKVPVLFDSGIRTAKDVIKAIALGADAVLIGRPIIYASAIAGEEGVIEWVNRLREELVRYLKIANITTMEQLKKLKLVKEG